MREGEIRLPAKVKVIVIGGGIQGLSVAYNLARLGERDVLVEKAGALRPEQDAAGLAG